MAAADLFATLISGYETDGSNVYEVEESYTI